MRIFIAGPYGDQNPPEVIAHNIEVADQVARDLMAMGHDVFVPQPMMAGWEKDPRITRAQILALCKTYLRYWAEAIYRIPGFSVGADSEMSEAHALGLTEVTLRKEG